MQEAEGGFLRRGQRGPVGAGGFEQLEGALHIGADEVAGAVDGAVDMALGGEVQEGAGAVRGQQRGHRWAVTNIDPREVVARVGGHWGQALQVAGVGERVEHQHGLVLLAQPVVHKIGADETGGSGEEDHDLKPGEKPVRTDIVTDERPQTSMAGSRHEVAFTVKQLVLSFTQKHI